MNLPIKCYAVNLSSRSDRCASIKKEFTYKDNLNLKIQPAISHHKGSISLWLSIKKIMEEVSNDDLIILCEDDHIFTSNYSFDILEKCINDADRLDAEILSGGVSWFKTGIQISNNLFWVEKFSGLQFTVIYKRFYQKIVTAQFQEFDQADYRISELAQKKFVIHPFISVQKDFGYSDITKRNDEERIVEELFQETSERFDLLKKVKIHYSGIKITDTCLENSEAELISILLHFIVEDNNQFDLERLGNKGFTVSSIIIQGNRVLEKWKGLCCCIESAITNEDDFAIITFEKSIDISDSYSKINFIKSIITSVTYGCELLLGNIEMFNHAVPITENLFWVDSFSSFSFIVVFAPVFEKILSESPSGDECDIYEYLSYITSHKLALYPFITEVTGNTIKTGFQEKGGQLSVYQSVYQKYLKQ